MGDSVARAMSGVAIFIALAGSAYAVSEGEVDTRHLAPKAVTAPKIARGAVQTSKIASGSVTKAKLAFDRASLTGAQGPAGPPGPEGERGEPGVGGIQGPPGVIGSLRREETSSQMVGAAEQLELTPTCDDDEFVVSGGHEGSVFINISRSFRSGNGWQINGYNTAATSQSLKAFAYCAPAP